MSLFHEKTGHLPAVSQFLHILKFSLTNTLATRIVIIVKRHTRPIGATMFANYLATTSTDYFCACFIDCHRVYMSIVPVADMGAYLKLGRKSSSHGGGAVLRYKPDTTQKLDMRNAYGAVCIATESELTATRDMLRDMAANGEIVDAYTGKTVKPTALNNGHACEYLICKRWDIEWEFDNAPHTVKGDIVVNGENYQVKFTNATVA